MIHGDLADRVERLREQRRPFVVATVVHVRRPTSVRPGDAALVEADGTLHGFVGGVCAESSVRLHGLRALETGEPLLLRLVPGDGDGGSDAGGEAGAIENPDGAVIEHNPCLSGGSMEIFLEPHVPPARIIVVGDSPIAQAITTLALAAGYDCLAGESGAVGAVQSAAAVIVSSHGNAEEEVLAAALGAGVPYVALIASRRRGEAVRGSLDVAPELAAQLHTPAGLDIGARTPPEIAISVLAEMVALRYADPVPGRPQAGVAQATVASAVAVAIDPVCGMKVAAVASAPHLRAGGEDVYFCCDGCRDAYAAEHAVS
ncbi:MAG: XdhC family protein [Solirubrobacteraceae bacterium]